MSFPCFLQAVVRCATERANPRWRRDETGRLSSGLVAASSRKPNSAAPLNIEVTIVSALSLRKHWRGVLQLATVLPP